MSTATVSLFAPARRDGTKVITGLVRFSYAHVFEPQRVNPNDDPKYSVSLLIPKTDTQTINLVNEAIKEATTAGLHLWGGKVPANLKTPLRDGDAERPDDPVYAGHFFIGANSKTKPGLVKPAGPGKVAEITDSSEFYSGCYGQASVNFYAYNTAGNRGIAAGLNNLIKLADGEFLGGRARAEDDFGAELSHDAADDLLS